MIVIVTKLTEGGSSMAVTAKPKTWSVADAKAHLSEVIERARHEGPQTITRNGKKAVVVVSIEEWSEVTKPKESLVEFFQNSPLPGSGLVIPEREKGGFRKVDL
jgi:prevent-host-death family protein